MYKRTMTYKDYDGNERTDDLYFNLSQAEVTEMNMLTPGGLVEKFTTLAKTKDPAEIIKTVKELILKSYGEKSPDGKYFRKSEEISRDFSQTEAFNILFMELATNADAAAEFANGIMSFVPNYTKEEALKALEDAKS